MLRIVLAMTCAVGCYRPSGELPCHATCTIADRQCPGTMVCGDDLRCHADGAVECTVDPAQPDAGHVPGCLGYGLADFTPECELTGASESITLHGTFSTDGVMCTKLHRQGDGSNVCAVIAREIVVDDVLDVSGSLPLALVAVDTLTVTSNGQIDAGSHTVAAKRGPAADDSRCVSSDGIDNGIGGSGGAGGTFHGAGGAGGMGESPGGATVPVAAPVQSLRGGCRGGRGGQGASEPTTDGGPSGGAVYLIAGTHVEISGGVYAGGGGGTIAVAHAGGGGGGSGGLIVLEAPMVSLLAGGVLLADGGGGSGGGGDLPATATGDDAAGPGAPIMAAAGGSGTSSGVAMGGSGGAGSFMPMNSGVDGVATTGVNAGGGGGGGGAGYIIVAGPFSTAGTVSPTFDQR